MSEPSYKGGCRLITVTTGVNTSKSKFRTEADNVDSKTIAGKKHCGSPDKRS